MKNKGTLNFIRGYLVGKNMTNSYAALKFAEKMHAGQVRKSNGDDYFSHPLEVATILINNGIDNDNVISAALLHDVLEDTDFSVVELRDLGLSKESIDAIQLVSKPKGFSKTEAEYQAYYSAISKNEIAVIVKLADRVHNLLTMPYGFSLEKKVKYIEETKKYILPLLKNSVWEHIELNKVLYNFKTIINSIIDFVEEAQNIQAKK